MNLRERPPRLATIVPAAAAHVGVDFPAPGNIHSSYEVRLLTYVSGLTGDNSLFLASPFWIGKYSEMYRQHLSLKRVGQTRREQYDCLPGVVAASRN